jgi:hypothetical protein
VGGALASTEIEEPFVALQKEENNFKFIASTSKRTRVMQWQHSITSVIIVHSSPRVSQLKFLTSTL